MAKPSTIHHYTELDLSDSQWVIVSLVESELGSVLHCCGEHILALSVSLLFPMSFSSISLSS